MNTLKNKTRNFPGHGWRGWGFCGKPCGNKNTACNAKTDDPVKILCAECLKETKREMHALSPRMDEEFHI